MFNRELKLSVGKKDRTNTDEVHPEDRIIEKAIHTAESIRPMFRDATFLVGSYVILDALRKVAVIYAEKK